MAAATTALDFDTLLAVKDSVLPAIEDAVIRWEQQSHDARLKGDSCSADQYANWAFAGDLIRGTVSTVLSGLMFEALGKSPITKNHREVQLPDLGPTQGPTLDVVDVEASTC